MMDPSHETLSKQEVESPASLGTNNHVTGKGVSWQEVRGSH